MKNIYLLPCLLLLTCTLPAQTDTVFISNSESSEALTPAVFTDARNEVFKMQDPCRFLLKLNLASLLGPQELHLSGEYKLHPAFSIDAGVQAIVRDDGDWMTSWTVRAEPRWYYGMSKKVKNGTQADNLSGNYLSLEYAYTRYRNKTQGNRNTLLLNWGVQRRLFNRGYFDLGFGAGMATVSSGPFNRGGRVFFARPRAAIGLAVARPKTGKGAGNYCETLRCFTEERRMWKIDFYNLLDFYKDYRYQWVSLAPNIGYEQKIAASAWSVHMEIGGLLSRAGFTVDNAGQKQTYNSHTYQTMAVLEPRWYYNLKRRIAQGKSGNSLSGTYVGVQSRWAYSYEQLGNVAPNIGDRRIKDWSLAPVWGIQHRFMRNGYVDFNIGPGLQLQQNTVTDENGEQMTSTQRNLIYIVSRLQVGLAF